MIHPHQPDLFVITEMYKEDNPPYILHDAKELFNYFVPGIVTDKFHYNSLTRVEIYEKVRLKLLESTGHTVTLYFKVRNKDNERYSFSGYHPRSEAVIFTPSLPHYADIILFFPTTVAQIKDAINTIAKANGGRFRGP